MTAQFALCKRTHRWTCFSSSPIRFPHSCCASVTTVMYSSLFEYPLRVGPKKMQRLAMTKKIKKKFASPAWVLLALWHVHSEHLWSISHALKHLEPKGQRRSFGITKGLLGIVAARPLTRPFRTWAMIHITCSETPWTKGPKKEF